MRPARRPTRRPARHPARHPARRRARGLALLPLLLGPLSGCGTFAQSYDPAGVDQLTIPTPSPRAADFVSTVDNPWLALEPGAVRRYTVTLPGAASPTERRVEVLPGRVVVAGVATTAVRSTLAGAGGAADPGARDGAAVVTTDYYAQDAAGNVWWLGHAAPGGGVGSWRAGEAGARAGLAMAARPRVGDGYRTAYVPGMVEDIATVSEVDGDTVRVDVTSERTPGGVVRETYRRGVGLASRSDSTTGEYDVLAP